MCLPLLLALAPLGALGCAAASDEGAQGASTEEELRTPLGSLQLRAGEATIDVTVSGTFFLRHEALLQRSGFPTERFSCSLSSRDAGGHALACNDAAGHPLALFVLEFAPGGGATLRLGESVVVADPKMSALGLRGPDPQPVVVTKAERLHPGVVAARLTEAIANVGAVPSPTLAGTAGTISGWSVFEGNVGLAVRVEGGGNPARVATCRSSSKSPLLWSSRPLGSSSGLASASVLTDRMKSSVTWTLGGCGD